LQKTALTMLLLYLYCRKYIADVCTTNAVELLNEEIRCRERVIRIFPNRDSAVCLIGALLMEFDDK
jgi:putative transposase